MGDDYSFFFGNKRNEYRFIEALFKFRKRPFDIFGSVLVYNMIERKYSYNVNLSYKKL